jgi:hypothetical protein
MGGIDGGSLPHVDASRRDSPSAARVKTSEFSIL